MLIGFVAYGVCRLMGVVAHWILSPTRVCHLISLLLIVFIYQCRLYCMVCRSIPLWCEGQMSLISDFLIDKKPSVEKNVLCILYKGKSYDVIQLTGFCLDFSHGKRDHILAR